MSSRSLPSSVAPRSRSVGRTSREDEGSSQRPGPSRSALPTGPRLPPSSTPRPQARPQPPRARMENVRTHSSTSTSSSASSFLDRMKMRSGETSSRTSLEDDYEERPKRGGGWASGRSRRTPPPEEDEEDEDEESAPLKQEGHGYDLWGRVTAVAGTLTVNVSKAWEKGIIHTADGEETPPGQESRLTKAMKAYHLDRARSAADLPTWLFDEQERGVTPKSWNVSKPMEYEDVFRPGNDGEARQRSGLRDIYDKAAASSSSPSSSSRRTGTGGEDGSRAANRLKAIREAKRSAAQPRSEVAAQERTPSARPVRVGLPAGPGRTRP